MNQRLERSGEAIEEPLQLFIGEATVIDRSANLEEIIIWKHRARLVLTRL